MIGRARINNYDGLGMKVFRGLIATATVLTTAGCFGYKPTEKPVEEPTPTATFTPAPTSTPKPSVPADNPTEVTESYRLLGELGAELNVNGARYFIPTQPGTPFELIRALYAEGGQRLTDSEIADYTNEWLDQIGIKDTDYEIGGIYPVPLFGKDGKVQDTPDNAPVVSIDDVVLKTLEDKATTQMRLFDDIYDAEKPNYHVEVSLNGNKVFERDIAFSTEIYHIDALIESLGMNLDDFYEDDVFNQSKFEDVVLGQIPFLLSYDGIEVPIWGNGGTYHYDVKVTDFRDGEEDLVSYTSFTVTTPVVQPTKKPDGGGDPNPTDPPPPTPVPQKTPTPAG